MSKQPENNDTPLTPAFNAVTPGTFCDIRHPLHRAVAAGDRDILPMLITKDADLEAQDHTGWTVLHHAVWHGNREMVERLLELGAFPHPITGCGKFPDEIARERGHTHLDDLLEKLNTEKKPSDLLADWLENPRAFSPGKNRKRKNPGRPENP